jgi:hypothetical protein
MRRLGNADPLEPYPGGARKPWKCRCLNEGCGKIIYPNRNNVMSGQRACKYCASNAPVDPAGAAAAMLDHGFATLVPFPGTGKPWLSRCTPPATWLLLATTTPQAAVGGAGSVPTVDLATHSRP